MLNFSSKSEVSKLTILINAILIVGLIAMNVAFYLQNKSIKAAIYNGEMTLALGQTMPPISGVDINGQNQIFNWKDDNRKTLLLVFSPKCGACIENMPYWKAILQQIDKSKFKVIVMSSISEGAEEFVEKYEIEDFPLVVEPDAKVYAKYLLHLTPQTVLLNSDGEIEKVWLGSIQPEQKESIEESLTINL